MLAFNSLKQNFLLVVISQSLLSLKSDCWDRSPKELGDRVEFPDLSKLDGYLKHWGTESVTKDKTVYSWIGEDGAVVSQRTYAELHAKASSIAHKLSTSRKPVIKPGDRVLLVTRARLY